MHRDTIFQYETMVPDTIKTRPFQVLCKLKKLT